MTWKVKKAFEKNHLVGWRKPLAEMTQKEIKNLLVHHREGYFEQEVKKKKNVPINKD
tara:strand:+ start:772 stop:942 length:171 start_codon:yes stop_codon:yes gene_type:complete